MTTDIIQTELSGGDLETLVGLLRTQQDVKYDVVTQAAKLRYEDGLLRVSGQDVLLTEDGVTTTDVVLRPTDIFEGGVSDRLGIPRAYLRRMRETAVQVNAFGDDPAAIGLTRALLDLNVNAWLQREPDRKFLVRGFHATGQEGLARALLSDRYAFLDNYDVLFGALDGIRQGGVATEIYSADLSERRMRVRISAPEIGALAPVLLHNYRSPFGGGSGRDLPLIKAGIDVRNSETGGGAFSVAPWFLVEVCKNGMTQSVETGVRRVHVGARLEMGTVRWGEDTQRKLIELVTAQTRDAVQTFLSQEYLDRAVFEIEALAGKPVTAATATIERIGNQFGFSEAEQATILDHFITGGCLTAGGVMQAVTSAAQTLDSPDRAAEYEDVALDVLAAV